MPKNLSVLVVDDDLEIRRLFADILELSGHHIAFAVDGEEAVQIVSRGDRHFDLVFLDYMMPGGDGFCVLERLHAIEPRLQVVLVTGEKRICEAPCPGPVRPLARLSKPFSLDALEALIEQVAAQEPLVRPG
jgi:CheY-like chemotaxis protein